MLYNFKTYGKSIRSNFTQERKRIYISPEEKLILSENISDELKEIITGLLLGDGTIRKQGQYSLLSVQQTNEALVNLLWSKCNMYKLVNKKVQCLYRINPITGKEKKIVYYFQTLTFPYFNLFYYAWYKLDQINNTRKKVLPSDLDLYFTPLAIAHWIMGDGTFDKGKAQRIILCTDCFSLIEVNRLRSLLLKKYTIDSYIKSSKSGKNKLIHRIAISGNNRLKLQNLVCPYIIPSLLHRIGINN